MNPPPEVVLHRRRKPKFPGVCVECEGETRRKSTIRVGGWSDWYFLSGLYILFHSETVRFPLCADCRPGFLARRWGLVCSMWGSIALALYLLYPNLRALGGHRERAAAFGVVLLVALAFKLIDFILPASLDAHLEGDQLHYCFRSPVLAEEFRELNPPSRLQVQPERGAPVDLHR